MGLYSIPVQQQVQQTKNSWPRFMEGLASTSQIEQFQRENLTPSGTPTFYTVASTGGGTAVMASNGTSLLITSSGAISNDVDVRHEIVFNRVPTWTALDPKTALSIDVVFVIPTVTTIEGFIGLIFSTTNAITALPTTVEHMGVFWDISAGANFTLSSGNASAQATTGSGVAVSAATTYRLNIFWNGLNSAILTLYTGGTTGIGDALTTPSTQHNVSALNSRNAFKLHFFIQNEATTARTLNISEWLATSS